jgi:two-component system sensor histidine kinase GlrK
MRLTPPTSIFQLALIGFLLAAVPLSAALVNTFVRIDKLSAQMQLAVHDSTQAVEAGRIIMAQVLNLERSSGQYWVLRDPAVLQRYEDQREQLAKAVIRLEALAPAEALSTRLKQLREREEQLYQQLRTVVGSSQGAASRLTKQHNLTRLADPIPFEVTQMSSAQSNQMSRQVKQVQDLLLLQALALIPLALILAIIFSVLINRPLRRLGAAIRRLGAGEFSTAVAVSGPQDIRELGEHLDWLRKRLSELDEQKRLFLHHVSHELKTPLTSLREGAELLRDEVVGRLNDEQREVADILRENSLQLQTQVEALLNFNAALAQEGLQHQETIALHTLLPEIINKHRLTLRARSIEVHTELQPVRLCGEREQVRTLLDNLLSNAIKYSPRGGQVRLRLWTEDDQARIDVIDDGPGIDAALRGQIFEPFFQGPEQARGHVKGTGLGLAIAQRYARLHRGSIEVQDSQEGAHLRVNLPLQSTGENGV